MLLNVNMSEETFAYFKGYDLSAVANLLLENLDITSMPQTSGKLSVVRKVEITNPDYLAMVKHYGPRSHRLSLARLFEYAAINDILSSVAVSPDDLPVIEKSYNIPAILSRAYQALREAASCMNVNDQHEKLCKEVTEELGRHVRKLIRLYDKEADTNADDTTVTDDNMGQM